jgi:hypothetical protein
MAINNFGSSIRTVTNIEGNIVDNDEWVKARAYHEHNDQVPVEETETDVGLSALYNKPSNAKRDPKVDEANNQDLKSRSLNQ